MICPHCSYEWDNRIEKPKTCPRCKQYLEKQKGKKAKLPQDNIR